MYNVCSKSCSFRRFMSSIFVWIIHIGNIERVKFQRTLCIFPFVKIFPIQKSAILINHLAAIYDRILPLYLLGLWKKFCVQVLNKIFSKKILLIFTLEKWDRIDHRWWQNTSDKIKQKTSKIQLFAIYLYLRKIFTFFKFPWYRIFPCFLYYLFLLWSHYIPNPHIYFRLDMYDFCDARDWRNIWPLSTSK